MGHDANHKPTHEKSGADEISIADLRGLAADDQHIIDAEAVSAMGVKGDGNPLHHDRYTDGEAGTVADGKVATHTALPNAHHPKAHKDDHDPQDGADPLDCGIPGSIGTGVNAEGAAHDFARSDHNHQHTASLHNAGGAAEISLDGLRGLASDDQHVLDSEVISAVLSYLNFQYVESEAEQTEIGGSYVLKTGASLQWTPPIAGDYIVEYSAEITNSSSSAECRAIVELDNGGTPGNGTELGFCAHEPETGNQYHMISGMKKITLTQAAHRIDWAFLEIGGGTAKIRRTRITVRRVA